MSQPPNPARRSVLVGGLSFGAAAAATGSPAALSESDPLAGEIARAVKAHFDALIYCGRLPDHTPEHAEAVEAENATLEHLEELAEALFARPVRSLADCVTYARIVEVFHDVPHEDDLPSLDLGDRAACTLALRLLQFAGATRSEEPATFAEQDRRAEALWSAREATHA